MRRHFARAVVFVSGWTLFFALSPSVATAQATASPTPAEAKTIARDAWIFGMPLVYVEKQIDVVTHTRKPRTTVDRQLQALHMLGVLICDEEEAVCHGRDVTTWRYQLATGIKPDVLIPEFDFPEKLPLRVSATERAGSITTPNISGASTGTWTQPVPDFDPKGAF